MVLGYAKVCKGGRTACITIKEIDNKVQRFPPMKSDAPAGSEPDVRAVPVVVAWRGSGGGIARRWVSKPTETGCTQTKAVRVRIVLDPPK